MVCHRLPPSQTHVVREPKHYGGQHCALGGYHLSAVADNPKVVRLQMPQPNAPHVLTPEASDPRPDAGPQFESVTYSARERRELSLVEERSRLGWGDLFDVTKRKPASKVVSFNPACRN